jgi:hypothetical protein
MNLSWVKDPIEICEVRAGTGSIEGNSAKRLVQVTVQIETLSAKARCHAIAILYRSSVGSDSRTTLLPWLVVTSESHEFGRT